MKFPVVLLGLLLMFSCNTKNGNAFTVTGTLLHSSAKTVYLEQNQPNRAFPVIVDSALIGKDGSFTVKAASKEEGLFNLRTDQSMLPFAVLINDVPRVTVKADMNLKSDPSVSGSPASQGIIDFDGKLALQRQAMTELRDKIDSIGHVTPSDSLSNNHIDSLRAIWFTALDALTTDLKTYTANLIDHSSSPMLSIYAFGLFQSVADNFSMPGFNRSETAAIVTKAAQKFPNHTAIQEWKKAEGSAKAPEFSLADTSGKMVSLSSFKGKYVLLDFWASWCGPCRMENPNVVAAYNQFKDKNFTILSVSLDENRAAWIKAIHDDGLNWNHVSDLKHWDSEAAALYNVTSIPYNFLIDPNGNIIEEDLRGQKLFQTLGAVLK